MTARALPAVSERRERLGRERTDALLRRRVRLEAEVRGQLEPLLGPAARPVGETAMAIDRGTGFAATGARARVEGGTVACPVP
jgi:hypothetical protein